VDLLKLNIEGGELAVLDDASGLDRVDALVTELHFDLHAGLTLADVRRRLRDFDVTVSRSDQDHPALHAIRRR
jgi:hypothetical protein